MPIHGVHSASSGGFNDIRDAILDMLKEDPEQKNTNFWQYENDGSIWPRLGELQKRTNRSNVYHSFRLAGMAAAGLLPEDYIDG